MTQLWRRAAAHSLRRAHGYRTADVVGPSCSESNLAATQYQPRGLAGIASDASKPLTGVAARADRALKNFLETFAFSRLRSPNISRFLHTGAHTALGAAVFWGSRRLCAVVRGGHAYVARWHGRCDGRLLMNVARCSEFSRGCDQAVWCRFNDIWRSCPASGHSSLHEHPALQAFTSHKLRRRYNRAVMPTGSSAQLSPNRRSAAPPAFQPTITPIDDVVSQRCGITDPTQSSV